MELYSEREEGVSQGTAYQPRQRIKSALLSVHGGLTRGNDRTGSHSRIATQYTCTSRGLDEIIYKENCPLFFLASATLSPPLCPPWLFSLPMLVIAVSLAHVHLQQTRHQRRHRQRRRDTCQAAAHNGELWREDARHHT